MFTTRAVVAGLVIATVLLVAIVEFFSTHTIGLTCCFDKHVAGVWIDCRSEQFNNHTCFAAIRQHGTCGFALYGSELQRPLRLVCTFTLYDLPTITQLIYFCIPVQHRFEFDDGWDESCK